MKKLKYLLLTILVTLLPVFLNALEIEGLYSKNVLVYDLDEDRVLYSIKEDEHKKYSLFKNNFTDLIKQIIDLSKENNISQINKLKEKYKNKSEVVNSNSDLLLKMYIPEEKITKNKDDHFFAFIPFFCYIFVAEQTRDLQRQ